MNKGKEVVVRNHVAKALWTPKFKKQVVRNRKAYTRKLKHKGNQ